MIPGKYIWMDGQLTLWNDAKIHVVNHSLHYGSAVFEGIRFYETDKGPAIFRNSDHLKRLFYSSTFMKMDLEYSEEDIIKAVIETVKTSNLKSGYIRPLFYLGERMGLNPVGIKPHVSISCWGWDKYLAADAVKVKTSKWRRVSPLADVCDAKLSGHYYNACMASIDAQTQGYDEALMLDQNDFVAEGPGENIFIVKDNILYTPEKGNLLPGITKDSITKIAKDLGYEIKEAKLTLKDVYSADEAFFTGTAAEVQPIESVDDKKIKNRIGEINLKLQKTYSDVVRGKNKRYLDW